MFFMADDEKDEKDDAEVSDDALLDLYESDEDEDEDKAEEGEEEYGY